MKKEDPPERMPCDVKSHKFIKSENSKKEVETNTFVPESYHALFEKENIEHFELLKPVNKITFEFYTNVDEKATFLHWVKILSSVEFNVNVNLDDIHIKEFTTDHKRFNRELKYETDGKLVFRIKASGKKEDLDRWSNNLCCVAKFLRDNYDITYFKNISEQENQGKETECR
jgi:hypothetical protein